MGRTGSNTAHHNPANRHPPRPRLAEGQRTVRSTPLQGRSFLCADSYRMRHRSAARPLGSVTMAEVVLRVRLTSGDHIDVTYDEPDTAETDDVVEHVISNLTENSGVLRSRHGDRLVALYGRGVAAIEVAPRGAIL